MSIAWFPDTILGIDMVYGTYKEVIWYRQTICIFHYCSRRPYQYHIVSRKSYTILECFFGIHKPIIWYLQTIISVQHGFRRPYEYYILFPKPFNVSKIISEDHLKHHMVWRNHTFLRLYIWSTSHMYGIWALLGSAHCAHFVVSAVPIFGAKSLHFVNSRSHTSYLMISLHLIHCCNASELSTSMNSLQALDLQAHQWPCSPMGGHKLSHQLICSSTCNYHSPRDPCGFIVESTYSPQTPYEVQL